MTMTVHALTIGRGLNKFETLDLSKLDPASVTETIERHATAYFSAVLPPMPPIIGEDYWSSMKDAMEFYHSTFVEVGERPKNCEAILAAMGETVAAYWRKYTVMENTTQQVRFSGLLGLRWLLPMYGDALRAWRGWDNDRCIAHIDEIAPTV